MTAGSSSLAGPVLAIDTCFDVCNCVLFSPVTETVLASRGEEMARGHAEAILGLIGDVMDEAAHAYADISRIVVSTGPGSFTGVRVGLATARGLALAIGCPIVGLSTLEVLARTQATQNLSVAVMDAKRGALYLAAYKQERAVIEPRMATPKETATLLLEHASSGDPAMLVGSGCQLIMPELEANGLACDVSSTVDRVSAEVLAQLGALAPLPAPGARPKALYLRAPDAKLPAKSRAAVQPGHLK